MAPKIKDKGEKQPAVSCAGCWGRASGLPHLGLSPSPAEVCPHFPPWQRPPLLAPCLLLSMPGPLFASYTHSVRPSTSHQVLGIQAVVHPYSGVLLKHKSEWDTDTTTQMNLDTIVLCKRSQTQEAVHCVTPGIWNVQNRHICRGREQTGCWELGGGGWGDC